MNAQDVLNRARTEGVELIRFMYCDFTGVQRGKVTAIDDLANRLSHGINLTTAQMAFTLVNTIVPIEGMSPSASCAWCRIRRPSRSCPGCPSTPA